MNKSLADRLPRMCVSWRETITGQIECHAERATKLQSPSTGSGVCSTDGKRICADVAGTASSDAKRTKTLTPEQQKYQNDLDETYKAANKKFPPKSRAILGRP
jgi:hypothetical protein